jgi:cell division transport system permease protein
MFSFLPASTIFEMLIPVAILLGVGIGFIGSTFTIRKHLKV